MIGSMLFQTNEKDESIDHEKEFPGIQNIAKFITYANDVKDIWIIHEVGGASLTKLLFDVKGIFSKRLDRMWLFY